MVKSYVKILKAWNVFAFNSFKISVEFLTDQNKFIPFPFINCFEIFDPMIFDSSKARSLDFRQTRSCT